MMIHKITPFIDLNRLLKGLDISSLEQPKVPKVFKTSKINWLKTLGTNVPWEFQNTKVSSSVCL